MTAIYELDAGEIDQVDGGVARFVLGAIVGGAIYDIVKGVVLGDIEAPPVPNMGFH